MQTHAFATPMKEGEEGVLELAAVGRRLFCRHNETVVLSSEELSDLSLTGGCQIQSDGVSFRDVEYLDFGGIEDPLKALGWEVASPASATKESPFVNSLGMKFVPVPGTDVLFCIHEVRYKDYEEYAKQAKETVDGQWKTQTNDGFEIKTDEKDHPVTRVSWDDAQKFCAWLSEKEGVTYRLPTDQEWSLTVGIGREEDWKEDTTPATVFKVTDVFPWGDEWPPPAGAGNYSDASRRAKAPRADAMYVEGGYDDGFPTTAPVMSFEANKLGLYDLGGNVWEWCEDWYSGEQKERVLRGGSWGSVERGGLFSSNRYRNTPDVRYGINGGFRVVVAVSSGGEAKPIAVSPSSPVRPSANTAMKPASATADKPSENTLGMKFVPVPDTTEFAPPTAAPPKDRSYTNGYSAELEVAIPDWLRQASAEGGRLAFQKTEDVPALFDLGEAAGFDDFVEVFCQTYAWLAVRRNGEVWGKTWGFDGKVSSFRPVQARSIVRGQIGQIVGKDGTLYRLYGGTVHGIRASQWGNLSVSAPTLDRATGFHIGGRLFSLAIDEEGDILGFSGINAQDGHILPPPDFFQNATRIASGPQTFFALEPGHPFRTWDVRTGRPFPLKAVPDDVVEMDVSDPAILLRKDGSILVIRSGGTVIEPGLAPPPGAEPAIRVRIGGGVYVQKPDGTWVCWTGGMGIVAKLIDRVATLGPLIDLDAGEFQFSSGDYANQALKGAFLIYITPKSLPDAVE